MASIKIPGPGSWRRAMPGEGFASEFVSFDYAADRWQEEFPAIQAEDGDYPPIAASASTGVSTFENPDSQFYHWLRQGDVGLLSLNASQFESAKSRYFEKATEAPATTIDCNDQDGKFFLWLEASEIHLLGLGKKNFDVIKAAYRSSGAPSHLQAGRFDDAAACQALGVDESELMAIADFIGFPSKPMDAVCADPDGNIGAADLKYLGQKKAIRDWALGQGRLFRTAGGEVITNR